MNNKYNGSLFSVTLLVGNIDSVDSLNKRYVSHTQQFSSLQFICFQFKIVEGCSVMEDKEDTA